MLFTITNRSWIPVVLAFLVSTILFPPVSGQTISIEILGTPSTWTLNAPNDFTDNSLTIDIVSDGSWQVTAADNDASNGKPNNGYLSNWSPGNGYVTVTGLDTHLHSPLKVQVGSSPQVLSIASSPLVFEGNGNSTGQIITFTQPVSYLDPILPTGYSYSMNVTFTGTTTG